MGNFINRIKKYLIARLPTAIVIFLIFAFIVIYLSKHIFITIKAGEGGVLWRRFFGGTVIGEKYGEGMHVIFPWDKLFVYNLRVQQVTHDFDVLTKNGLRIQLSISIRYHPQKLLLAVLHQQVGPEYVEKVVIPEIEQVLRIIIGKLDAEQVYTTATAGKKYSAIESAVHEGIEQVGQRFVKIDDVIIKRIKLPQKIEDAINYKLEQKHLALAYQFILKKETHEAKRKEIEAGGIKVYNETVDTSLSGQILKWKGIQATLELAKSKNAKVVVVGGGKDGLPVIGNIPLQDYFAHNQKNDQGETITKEAAGLKEAKNAIPDAKVKSSQSAIAVSPEAPVNKNVPAPASPNEIIKQKPSTGRQ